MVKVKKKRKQNKKKGKMLLDKRENILDKYLEIWRKAENKLIEGKEEEALILKEKSRKYYDKLIELGVNPKYIEDVMRNEGL